MTRSLSPCTTKPGSSEIHCFACLPTPRFAILLPLRSTNRPSSSSTSLILALAMLLLRCMRKGCNGDKPDDVGGNLDLKFVNDGVDHEDTDCLRWSRGPRFAF